MMSALEFNPERLPFEITSRTADETRAVGAALAEKLQSGDVVCVSGELGAGKTTFIQGVCRALGVKEAVTSPTFTLINEYRGRLRIYHFDFYRIDTEKEALALGLDDYFSNDGICLLEWAEKIRGLLPPHYYAVQLTWEENSESTNRLIKIYRQS